jgi:AAA15 family ATPase/GTPase
MINRIRIKGYKSLRDVVVHLSPFTIIVGPNAVGKSNLFDALVLLSRMVSFRSELTLALSFAKERVTLSSAA